jgi:benzodiazapine receptor
MWKSSGGEDSMNTSKQVCGLVVFLLLCLGVGFLGSLATTPNIDGWYSDIQKPSWTPPNAVFAPVWTALYILMAISAWMIWRMAETKRGIPLFLFFLQLILNAVWSWVFFGMQSPSAGMIDIVALWFVILAMIIAFWKINPLAGIIMIPYLLWVSFASALNFAIMQAMN